METAEMLVYIARRFAVVQSQSLQSCIFAVEQFLQLQSCNITSGTSFVFFFPLIVTCLVTLMADRVLS